MVICQVFFFIVIRDANGGECAATMAMIAARIENVNVLEIHQPAAFAFLSPSVIYTNIHQLSQTKSKSGSTKWEQMGKKNNSATARTKQH